MNTLLRSASILTAIAIASNSPASAQTLLVSQTNSGTQGSLESDDAHVTPDGRWVVFRTRSPLVPEDLVGNADVYVRDMVAGQTILVSKGPSGFAISGVSDEPSISDNGRYVAFASSSDDLGPGAIPGTQVFVRDMQTGVNRLVSVNASNQAASASATAPEISGDGRFVTYRSNASNLAGSTGTSPQVFRCDVSGPTVASIQMVSVTPIGAPATGGVSAGHAISRDGRFVAFYSDSSSLVPGDTNSAKDVFVRDMQLGVTTCVSMSVINAGQTGASSSLFPQISADGRFVAFSSFADDLVFGDSDHLDVFVHDRLLGLTKRASVASDGTQSNGSNGHQNTGASGTSISPDGRFVAFRSSATNLDPIDTYTTPDIFLHDLQTGVTRMIGLTNGGQLPGGGQSTESALTQNAQSVVFVSSATNLLLPAIDTNGGTSDVFLRPLGDPLAPVGMCFGDGSAAACPCGNNAAPGSQSGCANSGGQGAKLAGSGLTSVAGDTFSLNVTGIQGPVFTKFFQSTGRSDSPLGDGKLCMSGALVRLGENTSSISGAVSYPVGSNLKISVKGAIPPSGGVRVYQAWYRNAIPFCTPDTFNTTNGLSVVWTP